jgi:hypothetical protein
MKIPEYLKLKVQWPVQIAVGVDMQDVPRLLQQLLRVRLHQAYAWLQDLKVPPMLRRLWGLIPELLNRFVP